MDIENSFPAIDTIWKIAHIVLSAGKKTAAKTKFIYERNKLLQMRPKTRWQIYATRGQTLGRLNHRDPQPCLPLVVIFILRILRARPSDTDRPQ